METSSAQPGLGALAGFSASRCCRYRDPQGLFAPPTRSLFPQSPDGQPRAVWPGPASPSPRAPHLELVLRNPSAPLPAPLPTRIRLSGSEMLRLFLTPPLRSRCGRAAPLSCSLPRCRGIGSQTRAGTAPAAAGLGDTGRRRRRRLPGKWGRCWGAGGFVSPRRPDASLDPFAECPHPRGPFWGQTWRFCGRFADTTDAKLGWANHVEPEQVKSPKLNGLNQKPYPTSPRSRLGCGRAVTAPSPPFGGVTRLQVMKYLLDTKRRPPGSGALPPSWAWGKRHFGGRRGIW